MQTFLVACDSLARRAGPESVASVVAAAGEAWTRVLDGVWYVRTTASEQDVMTRLAVLAGDEDGIVVQAVVAEPRLINTVQRWMPGRAPAGREGRFCEQNVHVFPRAA